MDVVRFTADIQAWQGVPWHHQGRTRAGVDCVGLVAGALAEQGVDANIPGDYHASAVGALLVPQLEASPLLARRDPTAAVPGDLLVFRVRRWAQHLAVALGGDRMIHATRPAGVRAVTVSPLWRERLVAVYGWACAAGGGIHG